MKKIYAILLLAFLSLSLVSCTGGTGGESTDQQFRTNVYTGTQGLVMRIVPGSIPTRVFEEQNLNVLIELQNKGVYPLSGTIHISGYDPNIINFFEPDKSFGVLDERSPFVNIEGGIDTTEFTSGPITLPPGVDSINQKFVVNACYRYRTLASATVCVDPNPFSLVQTKSCKPGTVTMSGGQGAPVSVTSVIPEFSTNKVFFKINVRNSGIGTVIKSSSTTGGKCPFKLDFNDINQFDYRVELGGVQGKCSPERPVRLINNQVSIFCTFDIPKGNIDAYQTALTTTIDYGYKESLSTNVQILKAP